MTGALLAGGVAGLGLALLVAVVLRPRPGVALLVARLDAGPRVPASREGPAGDGRRGADRTRELRERLAARLAAEAAARGWCRGRTRTDLALLGRDLGPLLATKTLAAVGGLVWLPTLWLALRLAGVPLPLTMPAVLGPAAAAVGFVLPDLSLRSEAATARRDFRHVVGCFLDLVAMTLAGGRGLPEALLAAAAVGDTVGDTAGGRPDGGTWVMARIRQAVTNARLVGRTPWESLGALGEEVGVDELRDLAGTLGLAADDGAKVRASLGARAASMRRRELADLEGQAGERSQSMLVAQMLICAAFLVFLAYPATYRILSS